ncbi:MAG: sugar phosphate isomerase/epimerase [Lentisphaeria bacterium]|nr:sugar phosphate isomerase/epimerase [Lentisphaeria bacterium]
MRRYTASVKELGDSMERAQEYAAALERSKINRIELAFFPFVADTPESRLYGDTARKIKAAKSVEIASVHLPYMGGGKSWDPSAVDETLRQDVSTRLQKMIRDNADLMAPEVTMHCSMEPPLEEHPARLDQVSRTIEELLPLAGELDFSINVEYLPRRCVGNKPEELQTIVSRFGKEHVGICLDVNHVMSRYAELPEIIAELSPRIKAFHLSDYDGIDEKHWFPGQGIINWSAVMAAADKVPGNPLFIFENVYELDIGARKTDPYWHFKQIEDGFFFLENCVELERRMKEFVIE